MGRFYKRLIYAFQTGPQNIDLIDDVSFESAKKREQAKFGLHVQYVPIVPIKEGMQYARRTNLNA